jgi:predicted secreted Zn-dependent protease
MFASLGGARSSAKASPKADHVMKTYSVTGRTTGGVTNKIFTGDVRTSAVCKLIQKETGSREPDPGCADAAAFTYWENPDMLAGHVYAVDGTKDARAPWRAVMAKVTTTLPEHADKGAKGLHAADIARFLSRLATHERGHGTTGEQLVASSIAFLDSLPAKIPPNEVLATNRGVQKTLQAMLRLARWADQVFDEVTIHGTTSGSIANDTPTPALPPGLGL